MVRSARSARLEPWAACTALARGPSFETALRASSGRGRGVLADLMVRSARSARLEPWAACTALAARLARSRSAELRAELLAKDAVSLGRDGDGARAVDAADPALREALAANFRAERSREMRPALAPIEARPAQDTYRPGPATLSQRRDVDTHPAEQGDAGIGDHAAA